jgi:hypothetical protein
MSDRNRTPLSRRTFLGALATTAATTTAAPTRPVALVVPPTLAPQILFATSELKSALALHQIPLQVYNYLDQSPAANLTIDASLNGSPYLPKFPESLAITPGRQPNRSVLHATGTDPRGLSYALLDLADRVRHAPNPYDSLDIRTAIAEQPANQIRGIMKCFVSDVEDNPWYNDREQWSAYLTMLAANRFNRFHLSFGVGYDFTREIRDCYFHFAYPFLLDVPGYKVRARGLQGPLPTYERDNNLALLKFISSETAARGIHFQLGLWTHAYEWTESPHANYTFEGLTKQNHAAYCRDALYQLLTECPAISGITLRIHGESGVAEGDYAFWKTLFAGISRTGRKIEIDMHAKGMDDAMIETALATNLPVNISPKYLAEHMGLPYHQAAIRELEMPPEQPDHGFFAKSNGSRKFLRYGYGDLLATPRRYGILHRIWPGTQRMLLWGDPTMAAAYSRESSFCGSAGLELFEPLSFKGRKGSGLPGGRLGYLDKSLEPRHDWQKYLYTYRVWGRLLYNPDSSPDPWRRQLETDFSSAAPEMQAALANASRILPLITNAHGPSAANNNYWPEMYTNMSLIADSKTSPYSDTPSPKRFGAVSPFDPELFATCEEPASRKYSPLDVANWLEELATRAGGQLKAAELKLPAPHTPEFRRAQIDLSLQIGIGRFFANKFRAAVFYARGDIASCHEAYRQARDAWEDAAQLAAKAYRSDITYGWEPQLRGSWIGRLAAMNHDIDAIEELQSKAAPAALPARFTLPPAIVHIAPRLFQPGQPLALEVTASEPDSIVLHYRHVNQSEHFHSIPMESRFNSFHAAIPAAYTKSPFALMYYFELRAGPAKSWISPGLDATACNRPYYVCQQS